MSRSLDDKFAQFEDEFKAITESLSRKITAMTNEKDARALEKIGLEADNDIDDAKNSVSNIEREMRQWPYDQKTRAQTRIRVLNAEFEEKIKQVSGMMSRSEAGGAPEGLSKADKKRWKEERRRLLGANQSIDNSSISLQRTAQTLAETQAQGAATSATLLEQRELLVRARETVRETDSYLSKSRRVLRRMSRRVVTNKLIQALIVILEIGIVFLILYFKKCSTCK